MAEQTITLTASAYSVSSSTNFTVTNPSNAYVNIANITSGSYAEIRSTTTSTRYAYFYGFDFSQIPSDATVTSMVFKICAGVGASESSKRTVSLRNRTANTALSSEINTPVIYSEYRTNTTLTLTSLSYDDVIALGDSFAFAAKLSNDSSNALLVYGMEIAVTYDYPAVNKVDYIKDGVLKTLIDLTGDDTLPEDVTAGKLFHLATGEQAVGTGGGLEYETGTWSPSSNVQRQKIYFSKSHTIPPTIIAISADKTTASSTYTMMRMVVVDFAKLSGLDGTTSQPTAGIVSFVYRGSSSSYTFQSRLLTTGGESTTETSNANFRYYATETYIYTDVQAAANYYWRSNATHTWIAIWT